MKYLKQFRGAPGSGVRLKDFNPQFADKHEKKETALPEIEKLKQRMSSPTSESTHSQLTSSVSSYMLGFTDAMATTCTFFMIPLKAISAPTRWRPSSGNKNSI